MVSVSRSWRLDQFPNKLGASQILLLLLALFVAVGMAVEMSNWS